MSYELRVILVSYLAMLLIILALAYPIIDYNKKINTTTMVNIDLVIENAWLKYRRHYDIDRDRTPKGWVISTATFSAFTRAYFNDAEAMRKKGFFINIPVSDNPRLFGWEVYPAYNIDNNEIFIIKND